MLFHETSIRNLKVVHMIIISQTNQWIGECTYYLVSELSLGAQVVKKGSDNNVHSASISVVARSTPEPGILVKI